MNKAQQHDTDFFTWTEKQAAALRAGNVHAIDFENVAEEIEALGRSEIKAISSHLRQTLLHLIKLAIQPDSRSAKHWVDEILTFQADAVLEFSPGLEQRIDLGKAWRLACHGATTSLKRHKVMVPTMPSDCPLTLEDLLAENFNVEDAVSAVKAALGGL